MRLNDITCHGKKRKISTTEENISVIINSKWRKREKIRNRHSGFYRLPLLLHAACTALDEIQAMGFLSRVLVLHTSHH